MTGGEHRAVLAALLDRYGQTYAEQAGIKLADRPAPLYQMLVAATLASAPVSAEIAAAAATELWAAGLRTPRAMRDAGWQDRVDALGRGHYRRYDERTATELGIRPACCASAGAATCGGCATRRGATVAGSSRC